MSIPPGFPVAVIINPISGTRGNPEVARHRAAQAAGVLEAHGAAPEVFVTERPGHARALAGAAAGRGVTLVFAWGGDGTVNEVASALAFGPAALAIIPSGSGNGLARELGIDPRPDCALAEALAAPERRIDAGEIGGRLFVNVAGLGFDATVAAAFNAPGRTRRGLASYVWITLAELLRFEPATYGVSVVGVSRERTPMRQVKPMMLTIANSRQFGNGAVIAPAARLDDGHLDLVAIEARSLLRTLIDIRRLFDGTIDQLQGVTITSITEATISAAGPIRFHVDGEPMAGEATLAVRVHPGALRLRAKASAAAKGDR